LDGFAHCADSVPTYSCFKIKDLARAMLFKTPHLFKIWIQELNEAA
jgi:hypothetical protein